MVQPALALLCIPCHHAPSWNCPPLFSVTPSSNMYAVDFHRLSVLSTVQNRK